MVYCFRSLHSRFDILIIQSITDIVLIVYVLKALLDSNNLFLVCGFVQNVTNSYFRKDLCCVVGNSLHRVVCSATNTSYFLTKYNRFVTFLKNTVPYAWFNELGLTRDFRVIPELTVVSVLSAFNLGLNWD